MSTPTSVTEYQQGFAPAVAPYAEKLLDAAQDLTLNTPYTSYQDWARSQGLSGDQTARFSDLQNQSFQGAANLGQDPRSLRAGRGLASIASRLSNLNYNGQRFSNQYQNTQDPYNAAQFRTQSFTSPGQAERYMSPYIQNVIDRQIRDQARAGEIAGTQRAAQQVRSNAFGGSRGAIENAAANEALTQQANDTRNTGLQNAFMAGQGQFNNEQNARFNAANFGEQSRQYGYSQGANADALRAQYGLSANNLNMQQQQFGANYGLQGLQAGTAANTALGNLGQNLFGQQLSALNMQNAMGTQQQQNAQNMINTNLQNYANEQNYGTNNLGLLSNIINRAPITPQSSSIYQAQPSTLSQIIGLGTTVAGASGATVPKKKGGAIKSKQAPSGLHALFIKNLA